MRNPNIDKVTLKTVKIHRDEEKNIFALQFQIFFKHSLTPLIIYTMQNAAYFIILYSKEKYRTYADSGKLKRWLFLPPAIPLTLDKGPPIWKCFPKLFTPCSFSHTHTKAQWLRELNCSHHDTTSNRTLYTFAWRSAWIKSTLLHPLSRTHKRAKQIADV